MARNARASNSGPVPRLLLTVPGAPPALQVDSVWRAVVVGGHADLALEQVAKVVKPSAMAPKLDKALLSFIARDDIESIRTLSLERSDSQGLCQLLVALRSAPADGVTASTALAAALEHPEDPFEHRFLRKLFPSLHLPVQLAPGVPALLPATRTAGVLLLVDLLTGQGRQADALGWLQRLPVDPITVLALAGAHLSLGQAESVLLLTEKLTNDDDFSALGLVARGVALRLLDRQADAVEAFGQVISRPDRSPAVIVAALEERANVLRIRGDDLAAQADLERIGELGAMPAVVEVTVPQAVPEAPPEEPADPQAAMRQARIRVRRRITGLGEPGNFGGRHHRTYRDEVEAILTAGQFETCENMLLGLLDAVEDEAEERHTPIDPTFYLTLADLYQYQGLPLEQRATLERFLAARSQWGSVVEEGVDVESYLRPLVTTDPLTGAPLPTAQAEVDPTLGRISPRVRQLTQLHGTPARAQGQDIDLASH